MSCIESGVMTRKERFECLHKQISEIKDNLRTSNISVSVNNILDNLSDLMNNLSKDNQMMDIKSYINGISATIIQVKLHDITRSELVSLIEQMLNKIEEIISGEIKKENASKLRLLFLQLAEHSDKIINISEIFK